MEPGSRKDLDTFITEIQKEIAEELLEEFPDCKGFTVLYAAFNFEISILLSTYILELRENSNAVFFGFT